MTNPQLTPIDYRLRWKSARIPEQLHGRQLDDFQPYDSDSQYALDAARDLVAGFDAHLGQTSDSDRPGRGLLLVGLPGTGKTTLACAVLTEVHLVHRRNIRYVKVADYIRALTEVPGLRRKAERGDEEADERLAAILVEDDKVARRPLVLFDDIGKEHHTPSRFAPDRLEARLRERYEHALPSLATSNLPIERWAEMYSPAMRSWLHEAFEVIALTGPDQRKRARR